MSISWSLSTRLPNVIIKSRGVIYVRNQKFREELWQEASLVRDWLDCEKGSILGLIGKNGSGKTTIFHSILRFLDYSGDIQLDGKAISQETYKEIGYLPEERSLMPKLTVYEQVRYLANLKGMSTAEVKKKLPIWMENSK